MPDEAEARTQRAAQAIVAYLAGHPSAADSEQGIGQWWLPCMGVDVPRADLRRAIDRLVDERVLAATRLPGGQLIYRRAATTP